ncbi:uncharacterized protein LOC103699131 isoform X2 [Phoenix dactylifera]|uniref:Uncharacterized protein LOC103699131 isoform X2 n=1 Tax=Phoenix dactylifera TaxID=42345 RepID=A0A8B8J1F0_PHODC|nr:uncharacterized protein LOC103699131 isoform X2 [Phoenix dactylifera]
MSDRKTTDASEHASEEVPELMDQNEENSMPSSQAEEEAIRKKYGGIVPKKPPLISKDHERAYFDSADWALGKQGAPVEKPKGPLEALRPKLQVINLYPFPSMLPDILSCKTESSFSPQ